jgi:membrane-associated phospholipid phosphatase
LALEAWVDVDITSEVMRNIFDRRRPLDFPVNGNYHDTWFKTASSPLHADGSFPSGHTGWGFAVATTIARRTPKTSGSDTWPTDSPRLIWRHASRPAITSHQTPFSVRCLVTRSADSSYCVSDTRIRVHLYC